MNDFVLLILHFSKPVSSISVYQNSEQRNIRMEGNTGISNLLTPQLEAIS